jgi:hypothetical protein
LEMQQSVHKRHTTMLIWNLPMLDRSLVHFTSASSLKTFIQNRHTRQRMQCRSVYGRMKCTGYITDFTNNQVIISYYEVLH